MPVSGQVYHSFVDGIYWAVCEFALEIFGIVLGAEAELYNRIQDRIFGYEDYKVGKLSREKFAERMRALDARRGAVCGGVGGRSAGDCGGSQVEGVPGCFPDSGVSVSGWV